MAPAHRFQQRPPPKSAAWLVEPYLHATGFREYDARWRFPDDLNPRGLTRVGQAFGALLREQDGTLDRVVLGHDYRAYSQQCAHALALGLVGAGLEVVDIGLATTPMAYFAQHHLGIRGLAMVTASHNENGWTGVKMGTDLSLTLGPEEMDRLRTLALEADLPWQEGGGYRQDPGMAEAWMAHLVREGPLARSRPVVLATGHGTPGPFGMEVLRRLGCRPLPLHVDLDWDFPDGNPNPESERFMAELRSRAAAEGGVLGIGLDGDGDRLGVVDERGRPVYSDKVGLLLARWVARKVADPRFVVDVKCTSLVADPAVLPGTVTWEKTGHSYIKRAVREREAHLGFERSGHFFFRPPFGLGYDDGLRSAVLLLRMLDEEGRDLADLLDELPPTWQSPNYQPHVADTRKYAAVATVTAALEERLARGGDLAGVPLTAVRTINGARAECADGSWLLIRASSNRPSLVVMAESRTGPERTDALIQAAAALLADVPGVAALDRATAE